MIFEFSWAAYSEVTTFMKNQATVRSMYKQITTSLNQTINLSADHLIYAKRNATRIFFPM